MPYKTTMTTKDDSLQNGINSYKNFADAYIANTPGANEFVNVVARIEDFWFNI